MKIEKLPLTEGQYSYNLFATYGGQVTDRIQKAGVISVVAGDYFGTGYLNSHSNGMLVKNKWRTLL
jgi:hypothetical protein